MTDFRECVVDCHTAELIGSLGATSGYTTVRSKRIRPEYVVRSRQSQRELAGYVCGLYAPTGRVLIPRAILLRPSFARPNVLAVTDCKNNGRTNRHTKPRGDKPIARRLPQQWLHFLMFASSINDNGQSRSGSQSRRFVQQLCLSHGRPWNTDRAEY